MTEDEELERQYDWACKELEASDQHYKNMKANYKVVWAWYFIIVFLVLFWVLVFNWI